ncbi:NAD(P)H-binding protein [Novosphingobium album (ex Liu et al. 2023)]|uniref:NAD(P)H-binding protein n=1 Tax=Novosphingobium album (ex Liu et al. 2023) TaxID=3031130 RepID=A0ABT5WV69_9SPHN|nr:NAD(P)H-binding protein [Novosphingobium album (ex Liu et al. 2023)]MDE8653773.1 NAD(P)H-binding protein [Novosphingobium album (ex Liu et al. 2023)]
MQTTAETTARRALVLGATGGIGGAVAQALALHGWQVRALVRDPGKARTMPGIEWIQGDAMVRAEVVEAAADTHAIVHAVNPPGYRNWEKLVLPMIDNTIAAARAAGGARIVLPGTIYNFDPAATPLIDERSAQRPRTRKGRIRVTLENRLLAASADAPVLIVRAGDFFGPDCRNSWFGQAMVKPGVPVRRIVNPGKGTGHGWAYLPDLAETIVCLLAMEDRLRPFERVQFEGIWDAGGTMMADAIRRVTHQPDLPEAAFPWWLMRLLAPFGGFPREVIEIEEYWRHPVRLDNTRLLALLDEEPRTPLDTAIAATLAGLGCLPSTRLRTPRLREAAA